MKKHLTILLIIAGILFIGIGLMTGDNRWMLGGTFSAVAAVFINVLTWRKSGT